MRDKFFMLCLLLVTVGAQNILTTVDFTKNVAYTKTKFPINFVGLSFSYPQVLKNLTSTILRGFIKNSFLFSVNSTSWRISMKWQWPKGYKVGCEDYGSAVSPDITCIRDLQTNSDISGIGTFLKATIPLGSNAFLGFDQQKANYSDPDFLTVYDTYNYQILSSIGSIGYLFPIAQIYDKADLYEANSIRSSFSPSDFKQQSIDSWSKCLFEIAGPGLSINSSKEWMDTYYNYSSNDYGYFTVYAQPFAGISNLTIANMMNQSYYKPYLQSRFTGTAGIIDVNVGRPAITDVRLVDGDGIDGVTNGMGAAIWALDFALQSAVFGLQYVLFNNDFTAKNVQSPIGYFPNYTPNGIYYGMMFSSLLNEQPYQFVTNTVAAGTSSSIKVYSFYASSRLTFMIVNKDINPSASGQVQINMNTSFNMTCMYLSASDLSSKDISIAGYKFKGGNSSVQGSLQQLFYYPDNTGFKIPLNYSQAAYCYTLLPTYLFTKDETTLITAFEKQQFLLFLLTFILLALAL